jgi:hypothetical protein
MLYSPLVVSRPFYLMKLSSLYTLTNIPRGLPIRNRCSILKPSWSYLSSSFTDDSNVFYSSCVSGDKSNILSSETWGSDANSSNICLDCLIGGLKRGSLLLIDISRF